MMTNVAKAINIELIMNSHNNKNLTKTKLKSIILSTQKYLIYSNQLIYLYIVTILYIWVSSQS